MIKNIRRYSNRKLYDVGESRYVTLAHLVQAIRSGDRVVVRRRSDDTDITAETLATAILDAIKSEKFDASPALLEDFVRSHLTLTNLVPVAAAPIR